jgi:Predicted oxidoreductase
MSQAKDYDVIVAGSGLAGTLAATMAARGGASVLLLDRNEEINTGRKTVWGWTCGDAVAASHMEFIEKHTGAKFSYPEIDVRLMESWLCRLI